MVAANNGHLSVCKLLLEHGADPLVRNADCATAVDCAATSVVELASQLDRRHE